MKNEQVKSSIPSVAIRACAPEAASRFVDVPLHYHDELEFLPILEGPFTVVVDGVEYTANTGEVVFVNSGVPHRTYSTAPSRNGLVQFKESNFIFSDVSRIVKYSARLSSLSDSKVRILKGEEIYTLLLDTISEAEGKNCGYEMFVRSHVYRILGHLYRLGILTDPEQLYKSKELQKILPAIEYLNLHYAEDVALDDVAAILGFDASYFCRIFKSATGATFVEYLNFVRISKAEKMLSRTGESILSISEAVGFASVSYFNRVFKKIRGCSPRTYRATAYKNI